MPPLLDQAVAEARKLPDAEQEAIAALILEEIEDERRWEEPFAHSPGKLAALAARAEEQVKAGRCQTVGFYDAFLDLAGQDLVDPEAYKQVRSASNQ